MTIKIFNNGIPQHIYKEMTNYTDKSSKTKNQKKIAPMKIGRKNLSPW